MMHGRKNIKIEQSVPKRRHINFRRRGITQKKAYNQHYLLNCKQMYVCMNERLRPSYDDTLYE